MNMHSRAWIVFLFIAASTMPGQAAETDVDREQDMAQVVVTATALRESPLETAQPTAVVGGENLVRLRTISLGETLASQPGISATYFGPQASRPVIRGLGGERVQMYEDGGEALDVSALSNDHSVGIDPLIAQRIEVIRGPATLLYGNGAAGGLINVVTDRVPEHPAEQSFGGQLELRGGTALEERAVAAHLDGGGGAWAWHLDGHKRKTDDARIPGFALSRELRAALEGAGEEVDDTHGRVANTASETYGGALGGSWTGERGFAGAGVSRFDTNYGITNAGEEGVAVDMRQTRYDFKGELTDLGEVISSARLRASYNDYRHAEVEPTGEIGTLFDQKGLDTRLSFDHAFAGWRGNAGVQYRDIDLAVSGEEALLPPSQTRNIGYFAFEERPLGPVTLELGARLEQQKIDAGAGLPDYDRNTLSGSVGGVWKMTPAYALAINLNSTQRHPTATELYANGPHIAARRFEIGDTSLRRERSTTLDVSLRKTLGAWDGSLTAFHSDYSRYIFAALTGEEEGAGEEALPIARYSQADAQFSGFEAELRLPVVELGVGTLSSRLLGDYVRAKLKDGGGNLPQIPPLRCGGEIAFEHAQFWSGLSVMYYDRQSRIGPNELPTDGYTMVDLDLSYSLPYAGRKALLFLRGTNLLDEDARRHPSPLKDFAPLPRRGVSAGVRVEL